jgi:DNA-binding YbaB/EbfC family protein
MDFRSLIQQAQNIQSNLQSEMEKLEVEADSGGGMVTVRMNGKKEVLALTIDPSMVAENDLPLLQDLIIAAVNGAMRQVDEQLKSKLGSVASQFNIPGLFS